MECPYDDLKFDSAETLLTHLTKCLKAKKLGVFFCSKDLSHVFTDEFQASLHSKKCQTIKSTIISSTNIQNLIEKKANVETIKNILQILEKEKPEIVLTENENTYFLSTNNEKAIQNNQIRNESINTQISRFESIFSQNSPNNMSSTKIIDNKIESSFLNEKDNQFYDSLSITYKDGNFINKLIFKLFQSQTTNEHIFLSNLLFVKILNKEFYACLQENNNTKLKLICKFFPKNLKDLVSDSLLTISEKGVYIIHKMHIEDPPFLMNLAKKEEIICLFIKKQKLVFYSIIREKVQIINDYYGITFLIESSFANLLDFNLECSQILKERIKYSTEIENEEKLQRERKIELKNEQFVQNKNILKEIKKRVAEIEKRNDSIRSKNIETAQNAMEEHFKEKEDRIKTYFNNQINENHRKEYEFERLCEKLGKIKSELLQKESELSINFKSLFELEKVFLVLIDEEEILKEDIINRKTKSIEMAMKEESQDMINSMIEYAHCCFSCKKRISNVINYPCKHFAPYCSECLWNDAVDRICFYCYVPTQLVLVIKFN